MDTISSSPPITRFAPSPTGFLHIGGARTAIFNWLYARGRGGKFLLRIEDTDRARHNEEAVTAILDGLSWLGLDWDEEPISQYERRERHCEVALGLLEAGHAYRCFLTPEETTALRDEARAAGKKFISPWRERSDSPADMPFTVRFRAPMEGETVVKDAVQGTVSFPNSALDDLVLLRSGETPDQVGAPTYNLAVVVDDHDMGITHVVRGDDHLANAARQQQIYEVLGWTVPVFAHVPLIHGSDGAKLSKRHGALGVEAYRDDGFLAPALFNYLLRLGWSHGDEEIILLDRAKSIFDLSGINKAPARLDLDKLTHINSEYIKALSEQGLTTAVQPFLEAEYGALNDEQKERINRSVTFLKDRMQRLTDAPAAARFLLAPTPLEITGKAAKPLKKEGAMGHLSALAGLLESADWSSAALLNDQLSDYAAQNDLGFGQIGPPLRAALTAGAPSPSIGEILYSLGKIEALQRISCCLQDKL